MNWSGWDQLFCSYFADVCKTTLSAVLEEEGFTLTRSTETGESFYARDQFELEFDYFIESYPNYELLISVLETPHENSLNVSYSRYIPYWLLIENKALIDELTRLTFSSEKELSDALLRIYNEATPVYKKPVWTNQNLFNEKYEAFQRFNQML